MKPVRVLSLMLAVIFGFSHAQARADSAFERWLKWQKAESVRRVFLNVSPAGAVPGVVIASPQTSGPNYYFHWVRDAALTMNALVDLRDDSADPATISSLTRRLDEYIDFSQSNQASRAIEGLGEPKFNFDGTPYIGGWCRPQNDGPALRASTLIRFSRRLLAEGFSGYVRHKLYDGSAKSLIKADLEYVSHHWQDLNCDPWEEVVGRHFYNQTVQRRALIDGAKLADQLGDPMAASWYRLQAEQLRLELVRYWDVSTGAFIPTLDQVGGLLGKVSGLDAQTVLAVLHSGFEPSDAPVIAFDDPKVISTIEALTRVFASEYPINSRYGKGVAIGRYPEDVYDGAGFDHGNPWVLLTAAFANASYRIAVAKSAAGDLKSAAVWFEQGDAFLQRVQVHANPDGSLSEQIDRSTGYMTSARDLTWSHVEVIQAIRERESGDKLLHARH